MCTCRKWFLLEFVANSWLPREPQRVGPVNNIVSFYSRRGQNNYDIRSFVSWTDFVTKIFQFRRVVRNSAPKTFDQPTIIVISKSGAASRDCQVPSRRDVLSELTKMRYFKLFCSFFFFFYPFFDAAPKSIPRATPIPKRFRKSHRPPPTTIARVVRWLGGDRRPTVVVLQLRRAGGRDGPEHGATVQLQGRGTREKDGNPVGRPAGILQAEERGGMLHRVQLQVNEHVLVGTVFRSWRLPIEIQMCNVSGEHFLSYSYKEPGAYVMQDDCGSSSDVIAGGKSGKTTPTTTSRYDGPFRVTPHNFLAENCCPYTCLADYAEQQSKSTHIKAHQFDN